MRNDAVARDREGPRSVCGASPGRGWWRRRPGRRRRRPGIAAFAGRRMSSAAEEPGRRRDARPPAADPSHSRTFLNRPWTSWARPCHRQTTLEKTEQLSFRCRWSVLTQDVAVPITRAALGARRTPDPCPPDEHPGGVPAMAFAMDRSRNCQAIVPHRLTCECQPFRPPSPDTL